MRKLAQEWLERNTLNLAVGPRWALHAAALDAWRGEGSLDVLRTAIACEGGLCPSCYSSEEIYGGEVGEITVMSCITCRGEFYYG